MEINAAGGAVIQIGFLIRRHEHILQMMNVFFIQMPHIHIERRTVPFQLFLLRTHDLVAAFAVFPHGVVFAHETVAESIQFMSPHIVDTVHSRSAPAFRKHGGTPGNIRIDNRRSDFISQRKITACRERRKPAVKRIAGRVVARSLRMPAKAVDRNLAGNSHGFARKHIKTHAAGNMAVFCKKPRDDDVIQNMDTGQFTHFFGEISFNGASVHNMEPPCPRLPETDGTETSSALFGFKFSADFIKNGKAGFERIMPLRELFPFIAVCGFHIKINERFLIVIRFIRIKHRHEMIIAAAE